jgi:hypothetical protein
MYQENTFFTQCLSEFKGSRALRDNKYLVEKNYKTYMVNIAIQEAVFTLDNSKFSYIKCVYDFIYRYIYLFKIHLIEGNADILYYTISENTNEDCNQGFKHVLKVENF